mmetsp:Transcript_31642/g.71123  ORF Transcript_31642/g.71123 Transcript_31642/m.71123 type:complete len:304 (+) Transcript_31642:4114-5025(+)
MPPPPALFLARFVCVRKGGDLLRDGSGVLPTGRNIHALDPYRMPSALAFKKGKAAAERSLELHRQDHGGALPETVAVSLWGLEAIKSKGESLGLALALVGAEPVVEATGRVVRFELVPLEILGRPRIDVLASLSGIFRDSFAHVVELLDDLLVRAAGAAEEPVELNFVRKHALELQAEGADLGAATARIFSNPVGEFGSLVSDQVAEGRWEKSAELGGTWAERNAFAFGRNDRNFQGLDLQRPDSQGPGEASSLGGSHGGGRQGVSGRGGTECRATLDALMQSATQVVQCVDSVEYGLTDIQV